MITKCLKRHLLKSAAGLCILGLLMSPASAGGDLGGNCCTDLEERIAELEAYTVKKGNSSNMTLSLSGHVNRMLLHWDDQVTIDTRLVDNSNSSTRFRLKGSAKIGQGWSTGYVMEYETNPYPSISVNQVSNNIGDLFTTRHSFVWVTSEDLGTLSVGQTGFASWLTTAMDTSGTQMISNSNKLFNGGALQFRNSDGTLSGIPILGVANPYDFVRGELIKYETPSIAGFKLSASWSDNESRDVALRYGGKIEDFKIVGALAYGINEAADHDMLVGSLSVFHIPSGLNVSFTAGDRDTEGSTLDQSYYYVKGGLRRKYNDLGDTALSVDYYHHDEHAHTGGKFEQWGVQAAQYIDAAAMELYMAYSNSDYETAAVNDYQEIDMIMAGARIHF